MTATFLPNDSRKCSTPTTGINTKQRKSRRKFDLPYELLSQYFHMSQKEAAKSLKVSVITVKRNCKRYGFKWPYRANKYKAGRKPVLSAKGQAFKQLPLDCMLDDKEVQDECDTDTESVEDAEQLQKNYSAILLTFRKAPLDV